MSWIISPTAEGVYYFTVYGAAVASGGASFRIVVNPVTRHLTGVSPGGASNAGEVTLQLVGMPFSGDMRMELRAVGRPALTAGSITVVSPMELWAHFDLRGAAPGAYDVAARWSGGGEASLTGAFTVIQSGGTPPTAPQLRLSLTSPLRPHRAYILWLEYANTSDTDMPAPLFVVSSPQDPPMRLTPTEPWRSGPLQVLGISTDGPAGVLRPGRALSHPHLLLPDFRPQAPPVQRHADGRRLDADRLERCRGGGKADQRQS